MAMYIFEELHSLMWHFLFNSFSLHYCVMISIFRFLSLLGVLKCFGVENSIFIFMFSHKTLFEPSQSVVVESTIFIKEITLKDIKNL